MPAASSAEGSALPGVVERRVIDRNTGLIRFVKTQAISSNFFEAIRARREMVHPTSVMRFHASIPILEAQRWAKECGHAIGTKGWRAYCQAQLRSGNFSKLRGA